MPKFFFNFSRGGIVAKDAEGTDAQNFEEAKALAVGSLRELLADNIKANGANPVETVFVTDENGTELVAIHAREVLPEPLK
jgi:hypothetical protein